MGPSELSGGSGYRTTVGGGGGWTQKE